MSEVEVFTPSDPILPSKLEHLVEDGYDLKEKTQLFYYNFLRHEFEHPAGAIWARGYLDTTDHVAIYPPKGVALDDPIVEKVIAYLRRRYVKVLRLGQTGYEPI
jgi:hypothetical protein